ncbi:het-domain-containing protein [Diplodia corticola]|uniref:Het-domain-containing protein n=1 Tax=Diplodia corticola TaxID=236234 RepID=A0A1J9S2A1_9PEZI|nr:het-domain-containing protein [Diplodia corticola]OJD39091.1 het-domain-containing protein [Diplodia corticola]
MSATAQVEHDERSNGHLEELDEQANSEEINFQFSFEKRYDENSTKIIRPVLHVTRLDTIFSRTLEFDVGTVDGDPLGEPQAIAVPHVLSIADDKLRASLPVRKQTSDRGTRTIFQMIQGWVKSCDERPPEKDVAHCCSLSPTVPTRLIDISGAPQKLRLVETGGKAHAAYAALSYCRGETEPLKTSQDTLAAHMDDIAITKLPWMFLDAVKTARWLDLKYIWIDSLCIIQDDEADREHEMARMHNVFQNSYVTIVPERARCCREGFLKADNLWNPLATLTVRCESGEKGKMLLTQKKDNLPRDENHMAREPPHERAWTLQEVVLSPRVLIYTHDSVVWKCFCHDKGLVYNSLTGEAMGRDWNGYCASAGLTTMRLCPSGVILQPSVAATMPSFLLRQLDPGESGKLGRAQTRARQLYRIWEFLVQDYSNRRLTHPEDKLPALAGLAAYFQRALGSNNNNKNNRIKNTNNEESSDNNDDAAYVAGLWKGHFIHELCWTVDTKRATAAGTRVVRHTSATGTWRAPSWSWMSIDGPIAFEANRHTTFETSSHIKRFRCVAEPLLAHAPFSRLAPGAHVDVAGLVLPYDATEDCRVVFDVDAAGGYGGGGARGRARSSIGEIVCTSPAGAKPELWLLLVATCQTFSSQKRQGNLLPSGSIWGLVLQPAAKTAEGGGPADQSTGAFERVGYFTGGWRAAQQFPGNEREVRII